MKVASSLTTYVVCLVLIVGNVAHAAVDDGYEAANQVSGTCPQNADTTDKWKFAACNCTSYVAYRLNMNGFKFDNQFRVSRWGHGKDWDEAAEAAGVPMSTEPQVGDVAQWNLGEIGGDYGHVAYVEKVDRNDDGSVKSIIVSQYNEKNDRLYSRDTLTPGVYGYPGRFLHFVIRTPKRSDGNNGVFGWFPAVSDCSQASQWFFMNGGSENAPIGTATQASCPQACY